MNPFFLLAALSFSSLSAAGDLHVGAACKSSNDCRSSSDSPEGVGAICDGNFSCISKNCRGGRCQPAEEKPASKAPGSSHSSGAHRAPAETEPTEAESHPEDEPYHLEKVTMNDCGRQRAATELFANKPSKTAERSAQKVCDKYTPEQIDGRRRCTPPGTGSISGRR